MRTNIFTAVILFTVTHSFAQKAVDQAWNAFYQFFDVSKYQRGQFKFKGYVKAENAGKQSNARLWARVDKKKGIGFFDNMDNRPIVSDEWREYVVEGPIAKDAMLLLVGGLYMGTGKYYFDHFSLEVKKVEGEWEQFDISNADFESDSFEKNWKWFYLIEGFENKLITENAYEGKYSLLIDGSSRAAQSKFMEANGISIHYEAHGKGDTVLLLHGNSQSLQFFRNQITEFSKSFFVVAIDSRGQGYTTRDERKISYDLVTEDVNAFLDKMNLKHVNILGWSDGGIIGPMMAMKYPEKVKKLAIMGANLYNDNTSVDGKVNKMITRDRDELIRQNNPENQFRIELLDLMLNEPQIDPDALKQIQSPTLVMAGSKDVIKEAHTKLIASKINNSKLVIFNKGTHFEPSENPERFNKTVIDFFGNND